MPWKTIAEALGEAGIHFHPETLRLFMNNQERDLTKYPTTGPVPKKRRRGKRRVRARQTEGAREATNERTKRAAAAPPEPPEEGKLLKIERPL